MTETQEIRAKALEIAAVIWTSDTFHLPTGYELITMQKYQIDRLEAIKKYIADGSYLEVKPAE